MKWEAEVVEPVAAISVRSRRTTRNSLYLLGLHEVQPVEKNLNDS